MWFCTVCVFLTLEIKNVFLKEEIIKEMKASKSNILPLWSHCTCCYKLSFKMLKTQEVWELDTKCSSLGFWWADLDATGAPNLVTGKHPNEQNIEKTQTPSKHPKHPSDFSWTQILAQSLGPVVAVILYVVLLLLSVYSVLTCANQNLFWSCEMYLIVHLYRLWPNLGLGVLAHSSFPCFNLIAFKLPANQDFYETES